MATVELRQVSKSYGGHEVIRDLNLSVQDGAFTVFVGPSGCGKSTLLRMIAGLEVISQGDLMINGTRANDADPIARGVAMVFQNYALYPHMTVAQNIGFSLKMAGLSKPDIAAKVAAAAASLQIEPLMQRKPAQLSGGQRQRVAIGRAIVREPQVFLFDEPLSNLDAELRVSMRVEIARLHQRLGSTMIYVTHDQTEAMTLADTIVVLRAGTVEQSGSPQTLYDDPANAFVAGFIGSPRMNFLTTRVQNGQATLSGARTPVAIALPDQTVQLGIRPEHLLIREEGAVLDLTVEMVENLGGTRFAHGVLPDGTTVVAEAREHPGLRPGDRIPLAFTPGRMMAFTPEGTRLRTQA
jgi:lactose/L-arabinose transport system ATP-binding protein